MSFDVEQARADTPGCADVAYLNNAGASLPPTVVLETVVEHLRLEARVGGYVAADLVAERLADVRRSVARLVGASPDEIAFAENASRAWGTGLAALGPALRPGDRILVSHSEYGGNVVAALHLAERTGARVEVVPDDEDGALSVSALATMLDDRVRAVAVSWVPTQGGLVNPVGRVGELLRGHGAAYLVDATQAVGQLAVDVDEVGCDLLCATGRKYLRAPRGTGFLYVRREWIERLDPPVLDVHGAPWIATDRYELLADARRFETWETSVANRLGLGAAADYALAWGPAAIESRVRRLGAALRDRLDTVPGLRLLDLGTDHAALVSFTVAGIEAHDLAAHLRGAGVTVGVSTVDFARLDLEARGLDALVRASPHYYNREDELDRLAAAIEARRP